MCGVAMNDFPHRFLSPADLKVVVTVCRSIFKFDLTLLKIWKKLTHRLWRDVGSHSLLWSSVKLCCHKRNLEEMPQILSCTRCHIIIHFIFQNSSFNDYHIQTIAIRFAMVRKITVMTKISKGLLDQVTGKQN